jgi:hypothetical protein
MHLHPYLRCDTITTEVVVYLRNRLKRVVCRFVGAVSIPHFLHLQEQVRYGNRTYHPFSDNRLEMNALAGHAAA